MEDLVIGSEWLEYIELSPPSVADGPRMSSDGGRSVGRKKAIMGVVEAQWIGNDGVTSLGEPFVLARPSHVLEAFGGDGEIGIETRAGSVRFTSEVPPGGAALSLRGLGDERRLIPVGSLQVARNRPVFTPIAVPSGEFPLRYPVFAERFRNEDEFVTAVEALWTWMTAISPFDAFSDKLGFDAYFAPAPGSQGHFDTGDINYVCMPGATAVTFAGDNEIAKAKIGHFMLKRNRKRYGLVLINSRVRGGAGGLADEGYPSWASISQCEGEDWQAIAVHEIAHAFALADEYVEDTLADRRPGSEANYARNSSLDDAPWRSKFSSPPSEALIYSFSKQQTLGAGDPALDPGFVGLFQGARYRRDFYRPSLRCLMKQTNFPKFCRVCRDHLSGELSRL